ncbi:MAG: cell division FtsA domain-containing protein [Candidatus Gracilibacteria bacterium]|nr:cell division FtsA domain-containing protein [Candidatus Gracilibacteria bacterium]
MFQKLKDKFSKKNEDCTLSKGNFVLSLDIGTEIIKAIVMEVKDQKGYVLGSGRKRQTLGDMSGGAVTNIHGVIQNCRRAIDEASHMAGVVPDQMIMGIGGELVKGATTVINYEREDSLQPINLAELKNIVHKVQWKAFDQVRSQLAWETGYAELDVKLVNAAIVDVHIDGYRVANPLGFQGKNISVAIFNAFAPLVHFGALQSIGEELDIDLLSIAAEPYAVARCIGTEDANDFSGIFMDIGGGTSDIAVVRNGGIEGTKMFALGGRTFTKRLAQILNVSFEEAERVKLAYSGDELDAKSRERVRMAMIADAEVWLSGVQLTLGEFYNVDSLPNNIYLCGGGSGLPEIKEVLESTEWITELPFSKQPKINFIQPDDVTNIIDKTGLMKNPQDVTVMALGNIALDLAGEETVTSKVLRKAVKMMRN